VAIIWDKTTKTHTIYYKGVEVGQVAPADFDSAKSIETCQTEIAAKMTNDAKMEVRILIAEKPTPTDTTKEPKYLLGQGLKGFKWISLASEVHP
jgi:hypothetical protein